MCEAKTGHTLVGKPSAINTGEATDFHHGVDNYLVCAAFQCDACSGMSIGLTRIHHSQTSNLSHYVSIVKDVDFQWRPKAGETKQYDFVPEHIAAAATEAFECHASQHYRAAILLSRAVIEATAKDKQITTGNLKAKIDALADQNLIRPHVQAIAHGIRDYGNDMAHGDFVAPVEAEESQMVIQLVGEILDEVYQSPARLAAVKAAYEARTQPDS